MNDQLRLVDSMNHLGVGEVKMNWKILNFDEVPRMFNAAILTSVWTASVLTTLHNSLFRTSNL